MTTWAIVPVKSTRRSKSRLALSLAPLERRAFADALFRRVLNACVACPMIDHVLIASDDAQLAPPSPRVSLLLDALPHPPFAAVLDAALAHAHARGATQAVIMLGDLPLLGSRDVAEMVGMLASAQLVVAHDHSRRGVGAVACTLPAPLPMQLGHRDSFMRTLRAARARKLEVALVHNPRIAHDLDTSADLRRLAGSVGFRPLLPAVMNVSTTAAALRTYPRASSLRYRSRDHLSPDARPAESPVPDMSFVSSSARRDSK